jgi:ribosomal protein S18 acetylase RimI-like enzyme
MSALTEHTIRAAATEDDLSQIVALQAENLPHALSADERRAQGFVTLVHDIALLRAMNHPWPHIVATANGSGRIAAYALVMLPSFRERLPALEPMFERLDGLRRPGGVLHGKGYYIMGQVCVARAHRGRGLVERLYAEHRVRMSRDFDLMVTEVDRANTRSVRVHERAGCRVLDEYRSEEGRDWLVVAMDLRR